MSGERTRGGPRGPQDLSTRVTATEAEVATLHGLVEQAELRARAGEVCAEQDHERIAQLEARAVVDRELVAELVAEGIVNRAHAANLEEALRSSRQIGAAIGIVMANRRVNEADAFAVLRKASMDSNQRVRALAEEVVVSGDLSMLRTG